MHTPAFARLLSSIAVVGLLAGPGHAQGRVLVLGFDGADGRTTQMLMERGELPNLKRLSDTGTFAHLGTTTPDESPVAWASLNSGQNPAKTGVPGFVKRELGRLAPMPAAGHVLFEDRALEDMELEPGWAFLGQNPPALVALYAGLASALVLFLFLKLFVRLRKTAAITLSLLLGGVGGWAGFKASVAVPRVIEGVVGNPCKVGGFWEVAARAGVKSVVLEGAMTWDRPHVDGCHVLSGLGVPDARGANCDWAVYSTDAEPSSRAPQFTSTNTAGKVFRIDEKAGRYESRLYGPKDLARVGVLLEERARLHAKRDAGHALDPDLDRLEEIRSALSALEPQDHSEEGRLWLPLVIEPNTGGARVTIGGQAQELAVGQWSKWYSLTFEMNALVRLRAVTRVKLVSLSEPLELFVDSLQLDPGSTPFWQPVSQPPSFAAELADAIGTSYETVGWACLTMPFKDKEIDTATFLEDIQFTNRWRKSLLDVALARDDWRILMNVESTPDRVQHMLYQYFDPEHPKHDKDAAATKIEYFGRATTYADVIPATYREMDALVGEVLAKHVRPGDTLIVCSDHGFQSFRRQFHFNNWLVHEGYLVLRPGVTLADWDGLRFVDWEKTKAYALGLGSIYVNLKGREPTGIVEPADFEALLAEISEKLLRLEDEGQRAVHDIFRPSRVHSGPHLELEPDLLPGLAAGWRVSWRTTRGGIQLNADPNAVDPVVAGPFTKNMNNWSGDHVSVSGELVKGLFVCNRRVEIPEGGVDLLHIAPSVLALVGVPIPPEYDRPPLRFLD